MPRRTRVKIVRVSFWHRPFELDLEVLDGESINDALERNWTNGVIPGAAEREAEANDLEHYEILGEEA